MTAKEFFDIQNKEHSLKQIMDDGHYGVDIDDVLILLKEYARIKCLEAIKNTRHKAVEIVEQLYNPYTPDYNWSEPLTRSIHNIPNQDVMPEL